jgi:endonuclease YncB( thermonuclease family)
LIARHPFKVLVLALVFLPLPSYAEVIARVVSVHDGDTLTVLIGRRQVKVRLKDIDAPELRQPFGQRSKQSLADLCFGKPAVLDITNQDRYGRAIAHINCAGTDANTEQVRRGYAWTYARYARANSPLFALEAKARAAHRGLWADLAPVPPWNWRRKRLNRQASLPGPWAGAAPAGIGVTSPLESVSKQ